MTFGKPDKRQYQYIIITNHKKTLTGLIKRPILSCRVVVFTRYSAKDF